MKKHKPAAERSEEDGSMDDRLSQLPQPILQHILSLLDQATAMQTSVLSKPWRYLWTSRPNLDFIEIPPCRRLGNNESLLSALDKTLQRYHAHNLPIHELYVEMWTVDPESILFLKKWIPILRINDLSFVSKSMMDDPLTSVFEAENLQKLHLKGCRLNLTSIRNVLLCKHLHTLCLVSVNIADETFKKIVSICPLIENMTLNYCTGLTITFLQLNNLHHLKYFGFMTGGKKYIEDSEDDEEDEEDEEEHSIELVAPSLETIKIHAYLTSFHHHKHFPNLKSLILKEARLTSKSFDFFSWDLPSLENLKLKRCYGYFKEFRLFSPSIKNLTIIWHKYIARATIDAPAILYFKYSSTSLPSIFSFTTASSCWESHIRLDFDCIFDSSWFLSLNEVLQALSRSEISLHLENCGSGFGQITEELVVKPAIYGEPVVVEHLKLYLGGYTMDSYRAFINELFLICRPRNVAERELLLDPTMKKSCKILGVGREWRDDYSWSKDLEETSVEAFDQSGKQLINRVQGTGLLVICSAAKLLSKIQDMFPEIRFRMKWRERS